MRTRLSITRLAACLLPCIAASSATLAEGMGLAIPSAPPPLYLRVKLVLAEQTSKLKINAIYDLDIKQIKADSYQADIYDTNMNPVYSAVPVRSVACGSNTGWPTTAVAQVLDSETAPPADTCALNLELPPNEGPPLDFNVRLIAAESSSAGLTLGEEYAIQLEARPDGSYLAHLSDASGALLYRNLPTTTPTCPSGAELQMSTEASVVDRSSGTAAGCTVQLQISETLAIRIPGIPTDRPSPGLPYNPLHVPRTPAQ